MIIRKATKKDWPKIKQILRSTKEFGKDDLKDVKHIIKTGDGVSFILLDDNRIIGTVSGHWHDTPHGREANIEQIAVSSRYRGKGLGYRLLKKIISFFKSKGDKRVFSRWTAKKMAPWYINFGFKVVGKSQRTVDLCYKI